MKLFNFLLRRDRLTPSDNRNTNLQTKNELIDSRFEITKDDATAKKNGVNLLSLMYSQENEHLFV